MTSKENEIEYSLSDEDENQKSIVGWQIKASDIAIQPEEEKILNIDKEKVCEKAVGVAKKKGKNIYIILGSIIILLVVSIVGNIIQYDKNSELKKKNKTLKEKNEAYEWVLDSGVEAGVIGTIESSYGKSYILTANDYETYFEFWRNNYNKVDFMDKNIVLVLDGYGRYFYTYDQVQQVTQGKTWNGWAYTRQEAIRQGYRAWQ